MSKIKLGARVSSFLSETAAADLEQFFNSVMNSLLVNGKPVTKWSLWPEKRLLSSYLDLTPKVNENWIYDLDISHKFRGEVIATDVPEEYQQLEVRDGKVWTLGDLALIDSDVFYGLDNALSTTACLRVSERLRESNLDAWQTWQRYPAREVFDNCDPDSDESENADAETQAESHMS